MAEEKALSMEEAKKKLAELKKYMPEASNKIVYSFGRFLAGYLNSELSPQSFVLAYELALHDLQRGVGGFNNKPIQSELVDYPPMIYALLHMEIPQIAKAIFPEEFAVGVKTIFDEVNAIMKKKSSPQ